MSGKYQMYRNKTEFSLISCVITIHHTLSRPGNMADIEIFINNLEWHPKATDNPMMANLLWTVEICPCNMVYTGSHWLMGDTLKLQKEGVIIPSRKLANE